MARVFVSHASEDRDCASQLYQWLVAEDHEVFLDQDPGNGIAVGEDWDKRLRWADAVICVVTSAAVASTWCTSEVSIALSRGNRLLPVLAEPGMDHPLLPSAQYADLTTDSAAARAALRRVDAVGGFGWPDDRSPFPGLRPLDVDEHQVFFGRRGELEQLTGLLHVMADEPGWWTLTPMLPGADPVAALARELAAAAGQLGLGWTVAQVRHQLYDVGLTGLVDELLLAAPRRSAAVVAGGGSVRGAVHPGWVHRSGQIRRIAASGALGFGAGSRNAPAGVSRPATG